MNNFFTLLLILALIAIWYFIKKKPDKKYRNISIAIAIISFLGYGVSDRNNTTTTGTSSKTEIASSSKKEHQSSTDKQRDHKAKSSSKTDKSIKANKPKIYKGYTPVNQKLDLTNLSKASDETIIDNGIDVSVTGTVVSVGIINKDLYQLLISVPTSDQLFFASPSRREVNGIIHIGDKITVYGLLNGHGEVTESSVKSGTSKSFVGKKTTIIMDDHVVIN